MTVMLWSPRAGTFVPSAHLSYSVTGRIKCVCVTLPARVFLCGGTRVPVAGMEVLLLPTHQDSFLSQSSVKLRMGPFVGEKVICHII